MIEENGQWAGCYGAKVTYDEFDVFLEDSFLMDDLSEQNKTGRFATCIWGHTGIGKTEKVKQFKNKPIEWRGKKYSGYDVRSVPIAQFEEMGDLHGLPDKNVLVKKAISATEIDERWVPVDVFEGYQKQGWELDHTAGVRTMCAPPDWVPTEPGPCVMILDDFNRAKSTIIKGIMQFLQDYALMSWKLPPGCHIVLTSNPDEQDYFVTSIDSAVLQRIRSCTLKFDAKEWAVWAENSGIDGRVISYVLAYPEMLTTGVQRTSPRSISELGRFLRTVGKVSVRRLHMMASALLDEQTVASFITFVDRDFEMVVSPNDIVEGKSFVLDHLEDIMTRKEKRIDILGVTCDRLFAYLSRPDVQPEPKNVENVQKFLTNKWLEPEMRYVLLDRMNRASDRNSKMDKWFLGNRELLKLISNVV